MEIRFKKRFNFPDQVVSDAAARFQVVHNIKWAFGDDCRFTLATDEQGHDRVIRALLTLDPDATVRTARACYNGLKDFEHQRGKP